MKKLGVGVVGCGLIAQVMHLNYLRELSDRYDVVALCDLSTEVREACVSTRAGNRASSRRRYPQAERE